jgi:carbon-monoxide dehydrogenase large subunit
VSIGRSIRRHEDSQLVRGVARFVGDLHPPGMVHLRVVRAAVAHGRLTGIDTEAARASPGVIAVWTAADVVDELGAVPVIRPRVSFDERVLPYLQPVLAHDRVRYVGEPVAVVVATDQYLAEDTADLVDVEVAGLDVRLDMEERDGPTLFPEGNLVADLRAEFGDVDDAYAGAAAVVRTELRIGRHTGVPMETRGLVVEYDPLAEGLIVHGSTKVPHANRAQLAGHLGIAPSRITMRETAVGGGFGVRGEYYPEDFLVAWAAWRLRRPVGWIEDRQEHLVAANHSREQVHHAAMAVDAEGRILAMTSEFWSDHGAYVRTHSVRVPDLTLSMLPGPYDIGAYRGLAHCVVTNRTPTATYRAPGRFESSFVRERLIDMAAAAIGIDRVEIRRRNMVRPEQMPYSRQLLSTAEPVVLSEGDYPALLRRVADELDLEGLEARRARGEHVGYGIAAFLEKSGLGPWESGSVTIEGDGSVTVRTGCSSVGQGLRTVLAQIAADGLDIDPGRIRVELLDTGRTDYGTGSYASRSTATAGSAVHLAVRAVLAKARRVAAAELVAVADSLTYRAGVYATADGTRRLSLGELAALLDPVRATRLDLAPGLSATEHFHVEKVTYPYGVHAAVVSADDDTGAVVVERVVLGFDVGRAVNPMLVEGQPRRCRPGDRRSAARGAPVRRGGKPHRVDVHGLPDADGGGGSRDGRDHLRGRARRGQPAGGEGGRRGRHHRPGRGDRRGDRPRARSSGPRPPATDHAGTAPRRTRRVAGGRCDELRRARG